ncbi:MAG: GNAT family N-acetyltransferase [Acidobacteria bacterium]|nr:MAG: GNAT family N-acetyltransferase [Acidobacteriota bacterium]REK00092.1 MAG: GNAT family N-acetyltransferase [Acidobacteriota bacterium]
MTAPPSRGSGGFDAKPAAERLDASAVAALELLDRQSFPPGWSAAQWRSVLGGGRHLVLGLRRSGRTAVPGLAACAVLQVVPPEAELLRLLVHPSLRRRGLARLVLDAAFSILRRDGCTCCHLEVAAGNDAARQLYHDLGFQQRGVRHGYYGDGSDAVLMSLEL